MVKNKNKIGKTPAFIPLKFVKAGEYETSEEGESSEEEQNIPQTTDVRDLNPVRVPDGEEWLLQNVWGDINLDFNESSTRKKEKRKIVRKEQPLNRQLYVAFRGKGVPEPEQIRELHPDIISVNVIRRGRFAILTFSDEEAANHGYSVLCTKKINGCYLRVNRRVEKKCEDGLKLLLNSDDVTPRVKKNKNKLRKLRQKNKKQLSEPLQNSTVNEEAGNKGVTEEKTSNYVTVKPHIKRQKIALETDVVSLEKRRVAQKKALGTKVVTPQNTTVNEEVDNNDVTEKTMPNYVTRKPLIKRQKKALGTKVVSLKKRVAQKKALGTKVVTLQNTTVNEEAGNNDVTEKTMPNYVTIKPLIKRQKKALGTKVVSLKKRVALKKGIRNKTFFIKKRKVARVSK